MFRLVATTTAVLLLAGLGGCATPPVSSDEAGMTPAPPSKVDCWALSEMSETDQLAVLIDQDNGMTVGEWDAVIAVCADDLSLTLAEAIDAVKSRGSDAASPTTPGTIVKEETLGINLDGGYRATGSVTWYQAVSIESASQVPAGGCADLVSSNLDGYAIVGIPIDLAVDYTSSTSFEWPQTAEVQAVVQDTRAGRVVQDLLEFDCGEVEENLGGHRAYFPVVVGVVERSLWHLVMSPKNPNQPGGNVPQEDIDFTMVSFESVANVFGDEGIGRPIRSWYTVPGF